MKWSPGCKCCDGPALVTDCCFPVAAWDYFQAPASKVIQDCVPTANDYPYFTDLIVEVDGYFSSCIPAGSYQITNGGVAGSALDGGTVHACKWGGRFVFPTQSGCTSGTWRQHIVVVVEPGTVGAALKVSRNDPNAIDSSFLVGFQLSFASPTAIDLSSPTNVPFNSSLFPGTWDPLVPLVVYFA